jgi:hypothetical protein
VAKYQPKVWVTPHNSLPWFVLVKFGYDERLVSYLKKVPGAKWLPEPKLWQFPVELVPSLKSEAEQYGFVVSVSGARGADSSASPAPTLDP